MQAVSATFPGLPAATKRANSLKGETGSPLNPFVEPPFDRFRTGFDELRANGW